MAGALERKVWVRTKGSDLFPNIYIVICAPPGIGKTEVTWRVRDMWESLEEHHVANSSVTKASLVDDLNEATRRLVNPLQDPPVVNFNSLLVSSNELGVLIPSYDGEFMHALTDLYDNKGYSESRRTKDRRIKIEKSCLNIFAGCTPGYLRETLPPGAWDQGFLSRVIIVYSGEQELRSLFDEEEMNKEIDEKLKDQLQTIGNLYGRMKFTPEAKEFLDQWYLSGQEPKPDHPRLANYNTRRPAHLIKLSMVSSISENAKLEITKDNILRALDWLVEAEFYMPDIFKSMTSGGDSQIIEDTFHYLYTFYMKTGKKPIAEHRLVHFLSERTPAHNIVRIIEIMERARMIKREMVRGAGTCYTPVKPVKM